MSGGGTETPVGCEAAPGGSGGGGGKKKDSLGFAPSPAHLIIRDLGEIHSRLLDHRPVIQGETRYFVKEFEEKRGLREMRVLENLKNMIRETNEHTLPTCRATMQDSLNQVLQRWSICGECRGFLSGWMRCLICLSHIESLSPYSPALFLCKLKRVRVLRILSTHFLFLGVG
uniref:Biogenesis of lysosome-related organelles complex 1 subunit 5 n=1 Tax=Capra hircus TaxID=9925 RepID=A0A8C2XY49_CAPHI